MEYGSIEREIHVEASPEVVFEVLSTPAHIRAWWNVETDLGATAGATGELVWGDESNPRSHVAPYTVVDVDPPRLFSFRWVYPAGDVATPENSLLVSFELVPSAGGTVVRLTETGWREKGWEVAQLEAEYHQHVIGWDLYIGRLGDYLARLVSSS